MVSVFFSEAVRLKAPKVSTRCFIMIFKPHGRLRYDAGAFSIQHPPNRVPPTFQCYFRANRRRSFVKVDEASEDIHVLAEKLQRNKEYCDNEVIR